MTCLDAAALETAVRDVVPDALPADLVADENSVADEHFVAMLRAGAAEAGMAGILSRYAGRLFHFVHRIVRDPHLAQDVVQEVMGKVLQKHDLYQPGTNFRAWLFEVARNQALSTLRAHKRLPRPISALRGDTDRDVLERLQSEPEDRSLEEAEFMAEFARAVDELPEHYRVVFDLCVRQGVPYQQAADRLGMPPGTVAIRIMRARKLLFGALERHFDRLRRPPACFQKAG